jgi:hypothetical protein
MMNHPFVAECAKNVLKRKEIATQKDVAKRIDCLYQVVCGRNIRAQEWLLAREFVADNDEKTWQRFVQALLQANEFVFVD